MDESEIHIMQMYCQSPKRRFSFEFLKLGGHDFSLDRSVDSDKSFRLWVLELLLSGKFCDGSFLGWSSKLFCTVELDESDSDESSVDSKDTKNFLSLDLHTNCIYRISF